MTDDWDQNEGLRRREEGTRAICKGLGRVSVRESQRREAG